MKGFHFRLEPVLALRRQREETLQMQLAEAERALEGAVAELRAVDLEINREIAWAVRRRNPGLISVQTLSMASAYLTSLERRRDAQLQRISELKQQVETDRRELLEASKEKKALEKVREDQLLDFVRERSRREQNVVEDMATIRHVLRVRGSGYE